MKAEQHFGKETGSLGAVKGGRGIHAARKPALMKGTKFADTLASLAAGGKNSKPKTAAQPTGQPVKLRATQSTTQTVRQPAGQPEATPKATPAVVAQPHLPASAFLPHEAVPIVPTAADPPKTDKTRQPVRRRGAEAPIPAIPADRGDVEMKAPNGWRKSAAGQPVPPPLNSRPGDSPKRTVTESRRRPDSATTAALQPLDTVVAAGNPAMASMLLPREPHVVTPPTETVRKGIRAGKRAGEPIATFTRADRLSPPPDSAVSESGKRPFANDLAPKPVSQQPGAQRPAPRTERHPVSNAPTAPVAAAPVAVEPVPSDPAHAVPTVVKQDRPATLSEKKADPKPAEAAQTRPPILPSFAARVPEPTPTAGGHPTVVPPANNPAAEADKPALHDAAGKVSGMGGIGSREGATAVPAIASRSGDPSGERNEPHQGGTAQTFIATAAPIPRPEGVASFGTVAETAAVMPFDSAPLHEQVRMRLATLPDGAHEIALNLSPENLGKLQIDLKLSGGHMDAVVRAENPEAREALLRDLPALREALASNGIILSSFDVSLSGGGNPADQQAARQANGWEMAQGNRSRRDNGDENMTGAFRSGRTESPTEYNDGSGTHWIA